MRHNNFYKKIPLQQEQQGQGGVRTNHDIPTSLEDKFDMQEVAIAAVTDTFLNRRLTDLYDERITEAEFVNF